MFSAAAESLVFGKAQQLKARATASQEHEVALKELMQLQGLRRELSGLLALFKDMKLPTFDATVTVEASIIELDTVWADLKRLDLTEVEKLGAEKAVLKIQIGRLDAGILAAHQKIGKLGEQQRKQQTIILQNESGLSAKAGQLAVTTTGCCFTDAELLPALSSMGRFVDQEVA